MVQTDPCSVGNPEHMALVKCEISEKNPSAHVEMPGQRDSAPMAQDKSLKTIIVVAVVVFAVIVFLVIYADALANQRSEPPPMVPPCPSGWIGFQGMCYYFSEGKRNWTFSQSFCSSQNGLLLIFNSSLETEFVMRHKGKAPFWIGLRRELNQPWKWTNGENSTLQVIGEGDCAYLSTEATPSTSSCSTKLFWICGKVEEKCYVKM